jgi:hypothetical protein
MINWTERVTWHSRIYWYPAKLPQISPVILLHNWPLNIVTFCGSSMLVLHIGRSNQMLFPDRFHRVTLPWSRMKVVIEIPQISPVILLHNWPLKIVTFCGSSLLVLHIGRSDQMLFPDRFHRVTQPWSRMKVVIEPRFARKTEFPPSLNWVLLRSESVKSVRRKYGIKRKLDLIKLGFLG